MPRPYPRIAVIIRATPPETHYRCEFCGEHKIDRKIEIQLTHSRAEDEIFFIHSNCIKGMKERDIMVKLYPENLSLLDNHIQVIDN